MRIGTHTPCIQRSFNTNTRKTLSFGCEDCIPYDEGLQSHGLKPGKFSSLVEYITEGWAIIMTPPDVSKRDKENVKIVLHSKTLEDEANELGKTLYEGGAEALTKRIEHINTAELGAKKAREFLANLTANGGKSRAELIIAFTQQVNKLKGL